MTAWPRLIESVSVQAYIHPYQESHSSVHQYSFTGTSGLFVFSVQWLFLSAVTVDVIQGLIVETSVYTLG